MKLKTFTDEMVSAGEDTEGDIDFSSAGLYIVGLQVVGATFVSCVAAILSCWVLPVAAVSAVRTLAISGTAGLLCILKPVRVGRIRGVTTVFNALRPCVLIYVQVQVLEQLVHTCVPSDANGTSGLWRKVIFQIMTLFMIASGMIRARSPRSETDLPFAITGGSLLVIALLPPPAQPLTGPLCSPSTLGGAAERLLRAVLFSGLYVTHVYAAAPRRNAMNELVLCVMRCSAAAVWVLGCSLFETPLAIAQLGVCLYSRMGQEKEEKSVSHYASLDTRSDGGMSDVEGGVTGAGGIEAATLAYQSALHSLPAEEFESQMHALHGPEDVIAGLPTASFSIQGSMPPRPHAASASRGGLCWKLDMSGGGGGGGGGGGMSAERLAEIAGQL